MAEVEYGGIKVGGSKLLLIVPLIGTILGGAWGGFEVYQRYLDMESKINSYIAPDLSGIEQDLAVINEHMSTVNTHMEFVSKEIDLFKEEINLIKPNKLINFFVAIALWLILFLISNGNSPKLLSYPFGLKIQSYPNPLSPFLWLSISLISVASISNSLRILNKSGASGEKNPPAIAEFPGSILK